MWWGLRTLQLEQFLDAGLALSGGVYLITLSGGAYLMSASKNNLYAGCVSVGLFSAFLFAEAVTLRNFIALPLGLLAAGAAFVHCRQIVEARHPS